MPKVLVNQQYLTDIAEAIRNKGNTENTFLVSEMGEAIRGLNVGHVEILDDSFIERTLTSYEDSQLLTMRPYAFANCSLLSQISFPACTDIPSGAFARCSQLKSAIFPLCEIINNSAFYYCTSLTTINFPICKKIGPVAFSNCSTLSTVFFPACESVGQFAFGYCSKLRTASFPSCLYIGTYAFYSCKSLTALYLMGSSFCSLAGSTAFSSTPFTGTSGYIYVPSSLYDTYKTAANWSYFSSRFVSM